MTDEKLKIWNTMFIQKTQNMRKIDYKTEWPVIDYLDDYVRQISTPRSHAPEYMYFNVYNLPEKKKNVLGDMFKIRNGLIVISERMYSLLQDFDIGATLFFEIALYEYNQKDRRPGVYYILHIAEQKQALVAEESEKIDLKGINEKHGKIWNSDNDTGKIAISASAAAAGVDLWMDTNLRNRIFVSDRLKIAIKDAEIKASALAFLPCKIVA